MTISVSLAWKFLRSGQKKQTFIALNSWFSLIGIMLGVGTLIVVMSVMNGFRHDLLERILGYNAHIQLYAYSNDYDQDALYAILRNEPAITNFAPLFEGHVVASNQHATGGALVRVMHSNDITARPSLQHAIIRGESWEHIFNNKQLIIGANFAERYRLNVGDTLRLIAPNVANTALGSIPRSKTYSIGGIFEIGMYEYDNNVIFMSWADGTKFFKLPPQPTRYEINITDPEQVHKVSNILHQNLHQNFRLKHWQQTNASLVEALNIERNVMFIILTLIILVAAFNIISAQIMIVQHKESTIAMLRSLGAPRRLILRIFLLSGFYLGATGTLLGVILGTLFAVNIEQIRQFLQYFLKQNLFSPEIYYLIKLPVYIEPVEIAIVAVLAITITLIAALIPALKAANLNPIHILRHYE